MNLSAAIPYYFQDDGVIPNHPRFPVLIYSGVFTDLDSDQALSVFHRNRWLNSWINGVFDFHHYHSNVHEVLGVLSGYAELQIGGENGKLLEVKRGDVIVLPAGTGHKRISSGSGFRVAGAYPEGMSYNLKTGKNNERPQVLEEIRNVPLPVKDPVYGDNGPMFQYWKLPD
ncbi:cupin domain-containing protein [Paenibacillus sp. H1-7]|uniref:cupin domain-containing protein n=1 Tax=Paenibacillus sp. H1-7 TaxID=2282849 RepID=UPI001EF96054|nr:cupin domain-containing protein [Paenibacillus sp. H1-7]ULL13591.1 cupin domain-containing protein [Paenibacillus sp. H1-7]